MSEQKEYIKHLEAIAKQRSGLMAIISGLFLSDTHTEEEAHLKGKVAMTLMEVLSDDQCRVHDFIEVMTCEAAQSWVKEQIEIEKIKATAEGKEWGED